MKFVHFFLIALVLGIVSPAMGQKYLQKPFTEWTVDEVKKILNEAPWADQYQSERGLAASTMQQSAREAADNNISGSNRGNLGRGDIPAPVIIQLYSALPVRQAQVRAWQLGAKYDKMNPEEKAKFDASKANTLNCPLCKDYYIVKLTKMKDSSGAVDDGIFQTMTLENFKGKVWLGSDKGERLELFQFTPPKGAGEPAVFFFKRNREDGSPFFTPTDKEIKFLFANELRASSSNAYFYLIPASFSFKVSKMIVDGNLAF